MNLTEFEPAFRQFLIAMDRVPTDERIKTYFDSLQYYSAAEVIEALQQSKDNDEFLPKVSELVHWIKSHRKVKQIECEYCGGSGFELVYASFEIIGESHKCGPTVLKEQYEADPVTYRTFARRCRCRPVLS